MAKLKNATGADIHQGRAEQEELLIVGSNRSDVAAMTTTLAASPSASASGSALATNNVSIMIAGRDGWT